MPTYQYRCAACGHDLEATQKFSDAALTECPNCGGLLRKVFNAVGVVFKGSGFYGLTTGSAPRTVPAPTGVSRPAQARRTRRTASLRRRSRPRLAARRRTARPPRPQRSKPPAEPVDSAVDGDRASLTSRCASPSCLHPSRCPCPELAGPPTVAQLRPGGGLASSQAGGPRCAGCRAHRIRRDDLRRTADAGRGARLRSVGRRVHARCVRPRARPSRSAGRDRRVRSSPSRIWSASDLPRRWPRARSSPRSPSSRLVRM